VPGQDNQLFDRALLQRAWGGEESAKEELVRKYLPMVYRIVRGQCVRWADHEDLCQEGLIGLLKAISEYNPSRYAVKFSTFAYICILRRVANVIRQGQTKKSRALSMALSLNACLSTEENRTVQDSLMVAGADPLDVILGDWMEDRLRTVLKVHLSYVEYAVVDLLLQGLSTGEIQAELALGPKVIDNARTRARLKLRRLVEQYGSLLSPELPLSARKRLDLAMAVRVG